MNIDATVADEIFPDSEQMAAANNNQFLRKIGERIPTIKLVDPDSRIVYACIQKGRLVWGNNKLLAQVLATEEGKAALTALSADFENTPDIENREDVFLEGCRYTMGA